MKMGLAQLWQNLHSGFAFALFLRRGVADFRIGIDPLFVLLLFNLALEVAVDHITHRPDPNFNHFAFATFGLKLLLFSLSAYLLARLFNRREAILPMVLLFFSTMLPFALGEIAIVLLGEPLYFISPDLYQLVLLLFLAWLVAVALRAALHALEARLGAVLLILPLIIVIWLLPLRYGDWENSFWEANYSTPEDEYAAYRAMDAEALLYAQPQRVGEALQRLVPQRPGVSDLYFVSFGSYAFQDVFMKEGRYAQQTMEAHFDTHGHSLELVNNLQTREERPLATVSNLQRVLNHLGQSMDREEDVLMLYLTSHGSERHELAVDFWPLPLNDITPQRLRGLLDEAGIKWRVVVVSACYSGAFVDALRDEQTVVATAAAGDRQSFGCGNDNDFTYFGEALFRDELGRGMPLLSALEQAREAIAAREKREGLEPSLPQLHVGRQMVQKLNELEGPRRIECGGAVGGAEAVGC